MLLFSYETGYQCYHIYKIILKHHEFIAGREMSYSAKSSPAICTIL